MIATPLKKQCVAAGARWAGRNMKQPGTDELRDWVPFRVSDEEGVPYIDWCYAGDTRFTEPFFEDTVRVMLRRPFSLLFQHRTSFDELRDLCEGGRALEPAGLVFHMSRCGSTLVAQMLAAVPCNIVISEAPPIDSVLRMDLSSTPDIDRGEMLRSIVAALGRVRSSTEKRYFIKFDSWHTLYLDLILETFPTVPWIFLYRDPVEVIVSQMRQRGLQMVPGSLDGLLPDLSTAESLQVPPEEYCARVLARILRAALSRSRDKNCKLVNYSQLPGFMFDGFAADFHCNFSPLEIDQMREAAQFDAKRPQMFFEPDEQQKRSQATDAIRTAAAKWVDPLYDELEALRLNRPR